MTNNLMDIDKEIKLLKKQLDDKKYEYKKFREKAKKETINLKNKKMNISYGLNIEKIENARSNLIFRYGLTHMHKSCIEKALDDIRSGALELTGQENIWHDRYYVTNWRGYLKFDIQMVKHKHKQLTKEDLDDVYYYLTILINNRKFLKNETKYWRKKNENRYFW